MRPDAGKTIGLQFKTYCQSISCLFIRGLATAADRTENSDDILDVVADLMGNDIGLRKFARRTEPAGKLVKKGLIQINPVWSPGQ